MLQALGYYPTFCCFVTISGQYKSNYGLLSFNVIEILFIARGIDTNDVLRLPYGLR